MPRCFLILTFVFSLFVVNSSAQEKPKKINYTKEGYVKAKVIKYEVDGCGFLVELADKQKTKLMPDKLNDKLKKNNQKVWIKYTLPKKQLMSTCMAGQAIEVTDICKRK